MLDLFLFIALGVFSGLMAGLLGIGGGILVVPGLAVIFAKMGLPTNDIMQLSAGTSLAIMIFTSLSSAKTHVQSKNVVWPIYIRMIPYMLLMTIAGAYLAKYCPSVLLSFLFGLLLLFTGIKMALKLKAKPGQLPEPKKSTVRLTAGAIGALSGLLGVGGGAIAVPFLAHCHYPMRQATGTASLFTATIAWVGAISFALIGTGHLPIHWVSGYIYWPAVLCVAPFGILLAPLGALIGKRLSQDNIRRIFALLVLVLALKMFGIV